MLLSITNHVAMNIQDNKNLEVFNPSKGVLVEANTIDIAL